jgi:hypothetical protein
MEIITTAPRIRKYRQTIAGHAVARDYSLGTRCVSHPPDGDRNASRPQVTLR